MGMEENRATTIAFLTLALAQLWHVFSMRYPASPRLRNEITRNPWLWGALAVCGVLLLAAVYWPALADLLSIADPRLAGWAIAGAMSLLPLLVGQLALEVKRRRLSIEQQVGKEGRSPSQCCLARRCDPPSPPAVPERQDFSDRS